MTVSEIKSNFGLRETMEGYGIKIGRNGFCRCPFHKGDNTPSMKIYPQDNTFHCFGCGAHGDVITFVMKIDGIGFREACKKLSGEDLTNATRRQVALAMEKRKAREKAALRRNEALKTIGHRISYYRDRMHEFEPKTMDEEWSDEYAEAVKEYNKACHMEELIIDGLHKP